MDRGQGKLTANMVARLSKPGNYGDGGGLYLRVGPNDGSKSWVFRYRLMPDPVSGIPGKLVDMGIGSVQTFNLHEARGKARQHRQVVDAYRRGDSLHPMAAKKAAKEAARLEAARTRTFRECAEAYMAERKWGNAVHAKQWPTTLATYVYPQLGGVAVSAIDTPAVLRVLQPIWRDKTETASRVRGRIEAVLGWATVHGYRTGDNPARWPNHLDKVLQRKAEVRTVEHLAALPYAKIAEFMVALRGQKGSDARALEFAILTVARANEVIGARWSEINLSERVWVVPGSRMKAGKEHRVPLSDAALAVLGPVGDAGGPVFAGARGGPLGATAMLRVLRRMGVGVTGHGFRSTFSDWCAERTNFPSEVREMALAHAVSNRVEAAYRRGDMFEKRRQLAEAWSRWCAGIVGGEVVSLRAG